MTTRTSRAASPRGSSDPLVTSGISADTAAVGTGTSTADLVAAAVRACPDVVDLTAGAFGQVATYLPGRRVNGVRLGQQDGDAVEVHVVARYGVQAHVLAVQVRQAVWSVLPGRPVDVHIDDLEVPEP